MGVVFVFRIALRPSSALVLTNFTGSIAMSVTLNILGTVDAELARRIHDSRGPKPMSVTPLTLGGKVLWGGRHIIAPGEAVQFRVSALGDVGVKLLDALDRINEVGLFGVNARVEVLGAEVVRLGELFSPGPSSFGVEFLSPIRFARRRTMRRRRVKYEFCPNIENIIKSTLNYWLRTIGDGEFRDWPRLLRWVYNYVYTRDIYGRVVSTKLPNSDQPQLGFIGRAEYEIRSKREGRIRQFWALMRLAELMNTGTTRSIGFGHIKITSTKTKQAPRQ